MSRWNRTNILLLRVTPRWSDVCNFPMNSCHRLLTGTLYSSNVHFLSYKIQSSFSFIIECGSVFLLGSIFVFSYVHSRATYHYHLSLPMIVHIVVTLSLLCRITSLYSIPRLMKFNKCNHVHFHNLLFCTDFLRFSTLTTRVKVQLSHNIMWEKDNIKRIHNFFKLLSQNLKNFFFRFCITKF